MTTRAASKNKNKKPLQTSLGKAPTSVESEQIDLSHIGKTIHTSLFGLKQVLDLYETATDEVQGYITYECDIMYECRICRTIFRSLANFILHKRNYCRESYKKQNHTINEKLLRSEILVVSEEELPAKDVDKVPTSSPKCDLKINKPDEVNVVVSKCSKSKATSLSSILPRLIDKQESALTTSECLAEDISDETQHVDTDIKPNVALQSINSKSCVYQTMFDTKDNKLDFMKTEVMEIHDILENNEAIIGANGKIVVPEGEKNDVLKNNFMCIVCNQKFSTKKTLTYHINYKHNGSRKVYQCTECTDKFANTWGVFRHLYKVHRKNPAQVKKLRDKIHSNKITNDEHTIIKNNGIKPDLKVSNNTLPKVDSDDQQWIDDLECDNDLQRCGGCGRKFERKAALHSHAQFCTKRIALCNSIKENNNKKLQEEKQDKLNKPVKVFESTTYSPIEGSRKRKPQKILRYDYTKDVCDVPIKNDIIEFSRVLVKSDNCVNNTVINNESNEKDKNIENLSEKDGDHTTSCGNSNLSEPTEKISLATPSLGNDENMQLASNEGVNLSFEKIEIFSENNNSELNKSSKDSINSNKKKCKESRALDLKCVTYIDKEKNICLPCKKAFKSRKSLMRHMAIHFNWLRYQCKSCEYMSYQRSKCEHHLEKKHSITDKAVFNNYIIHLPHKKILELSTDFINYASICNTEIKNEIQDNDGTVQLTGTTSELSQKDTEENSVRAIDSSNSQDRSVREMIMEVIFGNVNTNCNTPTSEINDGSSNEPLSENTENPQSEEPSKEENVEIEEKSEEIGSVDTKLVVAKDRPVRNRTATVRKEFLYDMTQILKLKSNKNKEQSVDLALNKKPLRVYTRKPKGASQSKADKHLKLIENVNLNNKALQVTNNVQNVFTM